eukprot:3554398-Rhodomonas_salina.1
MRRAGGKEVGEADEEGGERGRKGGKKERDDSLSCESHPRASGEGKETRVLCGAEAAWRVGAGRPEQAATPANKTAAPRDDTS